MARTGIQLKIEDHDNMQPAFDSKDSYANLLHIISLINLADSSTEAVEAVYRFLSSTYGLRAMALECTVGSITNVHPFGEVSALHDADDGKIKPNSILLPLSDQSSDKGHITYVLSADSPIEETFLGAINSLLSNKIREYQFAQQLKSAENRDEQRIDEVTAIYEIGQAIDRIEISELLRLITHRAAHLMDAQACSLMLLDDSTDSIRVEAHHGLPIDALAQEQKIGEGIAGRVAQTGQPMLIVGDLHRDSRLTGVNLNPLIGSSMLVPMKSQDGRVLGVLSIRRKIPSPDFNNNDLKLFSVFATQASLAITNIRLYADLRIRANELLKLSTMSRVLISTLNLEELLTRVADDVRSTVGFARCCLYMRDNIKKVYVPRVWPGYSDTISKNPVRDGEGAVGAAGKNKQIVVFDSHQAPPEESNRHKIYLQMKGFARSIGADSYVACPILTSQNRCIGVLIADNKNKQSRITNDQVSLLSAFVSQAGIAIENARLYEEMQENYRNINRLKNYNENVLQSIGAGIISTDVLGKIARWNRAAEDTLQQTAEFFQDCSLIEVIQRLGLPETESRHLVDIIDRVSTTDERVHLHKISLHPAGKHPITLNLLLSRMVDHNQERSGIVLIFEDVTQEVRLEAEVEKMRRLADIGQLAAKMAHEVRNALSPIKGAAQIIRAELESQGSSSEWPDIIVAEVDGLSSLTSEMLDFARPTPLVPRPVVVEDFLSSAVQALSPFLLENRVSILWSVDENLPVLMADPIQLGQVVRNIVMNASQAMPDGGTITISASYDSGNRNVHLGFIDTGTGIAESEIDRIFRPFVTTRTKGTGLGLPIVQKIVDHHGGKVHMTSELGIGTSFILILPLEPPRDMGDLSHRDAPLISSQESGRFPDK